MAWMSPYTLRAFGQVARNLHQAATAFRASGYRLKKTLRLSLSAEETEALRAIMNETTTIIHGLTALEFFRRELIDGDDRVTELAVEATGALGVCSWLSSLGFMLAKQTHDGAAPVDLETVAPVHSGSAADFYGRLQTWTAFGYSGWQQEHAPSGVIWVAVYARDGCRPIRLSICGGNPVEIVLSSHSSKSNVVVPNFAHYL